MWETICTHKSTAERLTALWQGEAERQSALLSHSETALAVEEAAKLREENAALKLDALAATKALMTSAMESDARGRMIAWLRGGRPAMEDAAVQCAADVCDVACGEGCGGGAGGASPPAAATHRLRVAALGLTNVACSMIPEGIFMCSIDSELLEEEFLADRGGLHPVVRRRVQTETHLTCF